MPQKSDTIAIVTVHGTGDTATSADGPKWFQRGSAFSERVKQRLAQDGVQAQIVPHLWSGANSAWERERGANKLAHAIRRMYDRYDTIHVVAHSHGGNVANDAAVLLKWGLRRNAKKERFDSLTTIGTPFLDARTGWLQVVAGVLFLVIAWGSAIALPITAIGGLIAAYSTGNASSGTLALWAAYVLVVGPCVLFMLQMSRQGIRRILRPRRGGRTRTSIFSIWHKNDEAISFLQRVEELPLEPFPRGSLFRGARAAAIGWAVIAVIAVCLANPIAYGLHWADFFKFEANATANAPVSNVLALTFLGLLLAPVIFIAIYALYRFLVGGASEVGARGLMNSYAVDLLRGIALGRDGDQILCNVSTQSHTHATEEHVIDGACAERMQTGAHDAAGKLIDKYRWALFQVGGDSSASLTTLTTDAMTWDSLIHTTYFDQPEVADLIADYIAAKAKGATYAPVQAAASQPGAISAPPAPAPLEAPPAPVTHSETHSEALPASSSEVQAITPREIHIPPSHPEEPRPA